MRAFTSFHLIRFLLAASLLLQCSSPPGEVSPAGYSEPIRDSCKFEPDHHYLVSLPENLPEGRLLPLILVIDPHGDGKLGTEKFTGALKEIPAVIACSEKIRNNYPGFEQSLSNLEQDVLAKYPADPGRIIVAGFSGGARMAYYFGMRHRVLGVVMYGAGPGGPAPESGSKRLCLVSGTRDFNFMEQYLPPFKGLQDDGHRMTDYFRGTHEWPPSKNIRESVAFILKGDPDFPEEIPGRIAQELLSEYDSLRKSNDLFFAGKALEKAWLLSTDKKQRNSISGSIEVLRKEPDWFRSIRKFEGYLQNEMSLKQSYVEELSNPDTAWWRKEILNLDQKINSGRDPVAVDFLYRLKGFIGILLYSRINAVLQEGVPGDELDRLMIIYELAEPDSPDLVNFRERVQKLH